MRCCAFCHAWVLARGRAVIRGEVYGLYDKAVDVSGVGIADDSASILL
jgi:hypothetical protein